MLDRFLSMNECKYRKMDPKNPAWLHVVRSFIARINTKRRVEHPDCHSDCRRQMLRRSTSCSDEWPGCRWRPFCCPHFQRGNQKNFIIVADPPGLRPIWNNSNDTVCDSTGRVQLFRFRHSFPTLTASLWPSNRVYTVVHSNAWRKLFTSPSFVFIVKYYPVS